MVLESGLEAGREEGDAGEGAEAHEDRGADGRAPGLLVVVAASAVVVAGVRVRHLHDRGLDVDLAAQVVRVALKFVRVVLGEDREVVHAGGGDRERRFIAAAVHLQLVARVRALLDRGDGPAIKHLDAGLLEAQLRLRLELFQLGLSTMGLEPVTVRSQSG